MSYKEAEMKQLFEAFVSFGAGSNGPAAMEMDSAKLTKFCKENSVFNKKCTSTDSDIIFSKVKTKGARKIVFSEFVAALQLLAEKRGSAYEDVVDKAIEKGGPASSGTKAQPNKFYDDKSNWTGTAAKGGPSTVDLANQDLSKHLDRTDADVRGVKKAATTTARPTSAGGSSARPPSAKGARPVSATKDSVKSPRPGSRPGSAVKRPGSSASSKNTRLDPETTEGQLAELFTTFCAFGGGVQPSYLSAEMDGAKFVKFCKDSKLVGKKMTVTDVDLIFTKSKFDKTDRKITWDSFRQAALPQMAEKLGTSVEQVMEKAVAAGGPTSSGTKAQSNRFHDDKSLYTGTHAKGGPSTVDHANQDLSAHLDRAPADVRGVKK